MRIFCFCLLLILLMDTPSSAQNSTLDSLLALNSQYSKTDTAKIKLLIGITKAYLSVDPSTGLSFATEAVSMAEQLHQQVWTAEAFRVKGNCFAGMGQITEALEMFERAVNLFQKSGKQKEAAAANMNIGVMHAYLSDFPKALTYFLNTLHIYEQTGSKQEIADCLSNVANVYNILSDHTKALEYYQRAYQVNKALGSKDGLYTYFNNVGLLYLNLGQYPKALDHFQDALKLAEVLGEKQKKADVLNNFGVLYSELENYPKSLEYTQQSLNVKLEMGDQYGAALGYVNMGSRYLKLHDHDKALDSYQKALVYLKEVDDPGTTANCLANLGILYADQQDYTKSLEYRQNALQTYEKTDNKEGAAITLGGIGEIYIKAPDSVLLQHAAFPPAERWIKSEEILMKSLTLAKEISQSGSEQTAWYQLSVLYEKTGNFPKAYDAFVHYIEARDSSEGQDIKNQITRKEIQFEFDKKETALKFEQQLTSSQLEKQKLLSVQQRQALTIANKEKDLQRLAYLKEKAEKQEKEQQLALAEKDKQLQAADLATLAGEKALQLKSLAEKNALIGFLIASLIALVLGIFAFYAWQRQKRARLETAVQQQFTQQLFQNTEEERGRIARDLHDGVSHELLALRRELQNESASQRIDHIIGDIRQISRNLHPVMLESIGLQLSLETLCDQYMEQHELFITHDIQYPNRLSKANDLQLFRIVQEALTNTIKYAHADAVKVSLSARNNGVQLIIQDNGRGFDVANALSSGKAFGLNSILQRSKTIGGKAILQSSGEGTVIRVDIPEA